jgi:uncharacterized repeat protein (TIGR03803 family)
MDEEESMQYRKNLWFQGAALLLIAITLLLAPGAVAQSKYKTLHRFKGGKDGESIYAGLIFDQKGNLYGATTQGGAGGNGTVFKLAPSAGGSWTASVLYNFTGGTDGANPYASLIFDQKGNLYGTTAYGAQGSGAVFQLAPNADGSWTESVIYSFLGGKDGGNPSASLVFDQKGNLYGTTQDGGNGAPGNGTAFKLTPNADGSWTESVLYVFSGGEDGGNPTASLIMDSAGNLYGTTFYGNSGPCLGGECGVVFELMPNADGTWTESVLYRFKGGKDGGNPETDLIFDQAGNLYGTTKVGGCSGNCGVVFELTPQTDGSWMESVLYRFNGRDGRYPAAGLISDAAGNLYGTTVLGGDLSLCNNGSGCGVVYKLVPNSNGKWTETVLHRFLNRPGVFPYTGLIFDSSGNLYGTTFGDGNSTFGSVFEVTP